MPNLTITYDETHRGIGLWVQTRTDVPPWPILFDADQAHVLLRGLGEAINNGETALRTVNGDQWPRVEVGWDQAVGKVAVWLQSGPDGPRGPILLPRQSVRSDRRVALGHRRPRPPARGTGRDRGR